MKRIIAFVAFIFSTLVFCAAQSLLQPIALSKVANLLPRGVAYEPGKLFLVADTGRGAQPTLAPVGFTEAALVGAAPAGAAPASKAMRVEALVVLPAPSDLPAGSRFAALGEILRQLAAILGSVHTMEGIEYWSASRQRMRTLYAEAYRVTSLSDRSELPDPVDMKPAIPGFSEQFHAYLRDLTFGGNVFEYSLRIGSASLSLSSGNATTMSFLFLPLIPPHSVKMNILIIPCEEGLLVHFLSTIDAIDIVAGRVFESAGNKSLAVLAWFAGRTAAAGLTRDVKLPKNIDDVDRLK